ncbi:gamma-glutamyltransferase [Vitreoscilla filiformis]|uniref:Gamma-glutamyltransferase n=1 Tax=Vitreoscilla filiformis TaxID=63 RepID=A0A221KGJ6_VITFI|nr:gamma-glutamyltransferase family protein [Vitreoscilla filiformis]ASM78172.1 gamma-glutamyltransferase [Vitreoscilla filiformis]
MTPDNSNRHAFALRRWVGVMVGAALGAGISGCTHPPPEPLIVPESASGWRNNSETSFNRQAVATAHPQASAAGLEMLRAGGSALDAAIAAQMVLALVEPQSSGIGGGAFLMHWDGHTVQAWDGRETAPAAVTPNLFLQPNGQPLPFAQAQASGLAVGVPGAVRMLEAAHRQQGVLPWARLFEPAIRLAEEGFAIGPRLHALLSQLNPTQADAQARAYFYAPAPDAAGRWQPWPVGHRLKNPALARVLRRIASEGGAALHQGPVAADVVQRVQTHTRPGGLALADLAGYQPVLREPICTDWRERWRVCGFPPPSSGHLALMQILGTLDALPPLPAPVQPTSVEWLHRYAQASRLAFADRALYVADPAFVPAPAGDWRSLLAPTYLAQRARLVGERDMGPAPAGTPTLTPVAWAPQPHQPEYGTSHLSVIDAQGRAVSMTTTIEAAFGTGIMSDGGTGLPGGFLLNNQLTDFSFTPQDAQGRSIANRVEPGKRPRSSMSPTLVFDRHTGQLVMSVGSPGGAAIIHYTAKTLLGTLAWQMGPQAAIDLPNVVHTNGAALVLEKGRFDANILQALQARGYTVQEQELTSGLQALTAPQAQPPGPWRGVAGRGGADPRREGVVLGD